MTKSQSDHTDRINAADWDPTGTRIVTASDDHTVAIWDAGTFDLIERINDPDSLGVSHVAWSPAGRFIAFVNSNNMMTVWDVNAQDIGARVSLSSTTLNKLVWSPDGTRIATAGEDGTVKVWDASNGALIDTLTYPGPVYALDWHPNGEQIAYGGADLTGSPPEVVIVDAPEIPPTATPTFTPTATPTSTATPTATPTLTATPVPQPGAGWLLFHSNRPEPAANTAGAFNLYAADLSVSPPLVQRLTANTDPNVRDELPVWSPDHTRVAFTRRAGTASDVCLLALATSAVVCTDTPAENEDYPAWADSGLYVAYVSDADGENDIYKHALSGGGFGASRVNLTHRTGTDGNDDHPDWHGDWIVYASTRDGNKELYVMFADADALNAGDGQQRQQLTDTTDKTHKQPAWSPLGDKIAYTRDTNGLDDTYVRPMAFNGGTWTAGAATILTSGQPGQYRFMAWRSTDASQSTLAAVRSLDDDKDIVIITTGLGGGLSDPGVPVNSSAFEDDPDW